MSGKRLLKYAEAQKLSAINKIARRANHLPIFGSRVKPQNKKYFAFTEMQIRAYLSPSRPDQRGARDRHERGTGMRWTRKLRQTSAADAYGEDVWS